MESKRKPFWLFQLLIMFSLVTLITRSAANDEELARDALEADLVSNRARAEEAALPECTADIAIETLLALNVIDLLKVPFYKHSNSILNRNIHDLPTFNWVDIRPGCLNLSVLPFYNQTSKLFFTRSSPFIKSYLNITGEDFIDALTAIVDVADPTIQPEEILPLFQNVKLQERRAGLYFRTGAHQNQWDLEFSVPLYYIERNFFLTPEEIEEISFSPALRDLSEGSSNSEAEELLTEHLVSDRVGIGDFRIHALYAPWHTDTTRWSVGGFLTLPTAFSFTQGIIGGSFCKFRNIPFFDLEEIICTTLQVGELIPEQIQVKQQLTDLAFSVLDNLTANVADTSLGNNGHVTIAPIAQYEQFFCDEWGVRAQGSVQYVVPAKERRYFIKKIDPDEFNRDFTNPVDAVANLAFIRRKIIDNFFPTVFNVTVKPGPIVDLNAALFWNYQAIRAVFGYDFWWQGQERIEVSKQQAKNFLVDRALNPSGLQHKIFASVDLSFPYCSGIFYAGLRGDYTFSGHGIGKDFTLAINLAFSY